MSNISDDNFSKNKTSSRESPSGLVPLFVLAHFMHHVPGFIIQPLMPSIRDFFHLDYTQVGWLNSSYNLAYGASNLPAGWLGGWIAPRILIALGVAGVAFAGLLVGISPTYLMVVLSLFLLGILGGGYHPSASPMISDATPRDKRGRILGIHQTGGTLANLLTPLIVAGLLTFLSFRGIYIALTIPTLIYGIYLYLLLKSRGLGDTPRKADSPQASPQTEEPGSLRRMVAFVVVGAAVQVFVFTNFSFISLLVTDKFKGPLWLASLMLAVPHLAGLFAGPVGGHISDKLGKVRVMLAASLAAGPVIYLLSLATHWWFLAIVLLMMGVCMYVAMPVSESYVINHASTRHRSTILGVYYFASRGGPGILSPIIGGIIDQYNFSVAFTAVGATMLAIALVCSVFLWGAKE